MEPSADTGTRAVSETESDPASTPGAVSNAAVSNAAVSNAAASNAAVSNAAGNVETVRAIQEALGRGDILAPMAHMAKKVRWAVATADREAAPFFKEYIGREGVLDFMQDMDVVDMTAFEIKAVFGQGDLVGVWLRMAFTAPTGRTVDMDETQIWRFSGGKVISVDLFPDTQAVAAAFA